jgi:hypothetical protein
VIAILRSLWSQAIFHRLAIAFAVFAVCTAVSSASTQRQPRLIGSYGLVTRIETPSRIVAGGSLSIDTYNSSTGAITGHGFDESEVAPASMTGTVHGSTVTMHVANRYGVASDRGNVYPNGTIRGTITAKVGKVTERGTWTMTPFELVVQKAGFSLERFGHQSTDLTWGVVVENVSTTRDAVDVNLKAEPLTKVGRAISGDQLGLVPPLVRVIPAGDVVYLGAVGSLDGSVQVSRIRVSVTHVSSRLTRRYTLPPVSDVKIDRATRRVTATLTNPYATRMSTYDYTPSVVFYDRGGHVIGGSDDGDIGDVGQSQWIKPGGRASVEIQIPDQIAGDRIGSARVTVLAG